MVNIFRRITPLLLIFLIGVVMGVYFSFGNSNPVYKFIDSADGESNTPFINPTVTADLDKHFIINFQPLRSEYLEIQKKYKEKTHIYFDYLNNAAWVGINERELFPAASTLKVPLAMAVYKAAEQGKINLSDKYVLSRTDLDDRFGDLHLKGEGYEVELRELVRIMLEQSDNTSMRALFSALELKGINRPLDDVYNFMGWEFNTFGEVPNYERIHLKVLSNMFLALYNAKYVNLEHSNEILTYLTNTKFKDKIQAGVPEGVRVAHKVGIAADKESFSDCGIVYAAHRHYLLCTGFSGKEETANKFMSEISKATYNYVSNN